MESVVVVATSRSVPLTEVTSAGVVVNGVRTAQYGVSIATPDHDTVIRVGHRVAENGDIVRRRRAGEGVPNAPAAVIGRISVNGHVMAVEPVNGVGIIPIFVVVVPDGDEHVLDVHVLNLGVAGTVHDDGRAILLVCQRRTVCSSLNLAVRTAVYQQKVFTSAVDE